MSVGWITSWGLGKFAGVEVGGAGVGVSVSVAGIKVSVGTEVSPPPGAHAAAINTR